ncbi:MAG TPA: formate dehydrogenase accessory sulfurtransferase FdhD [Mycobacteriales bacterium]|jgi:FdhD protein|nr:formate dehydrogenase accessory sulfurtransferase FdhD [Mycobacteriales bacterium]
MGRVTGRRRVLRVDAERVVRRPDTLVVEEPLEIRIAGRPVTVTMRTPGDDFDLAHGFLVTEGIVRSPAEVDMIRYCAGADEDGRNTYNVLDVALADGVALPDLTLERNFYATSSCGVCGKASIDALEVTAAWPIASDDLSVDAAVLAALPDRLRAAQRVFDSTGGLHAAGLFDAAGELLCAREDVGRHNAVDKLVGWALRERGLPLAGCILVVSGRASFELTQKALVAGIPMLAAVSAPSTLAVDLAERVGMTLVGFLRGPSMNIYTGPQRITTPAG